MEYGKCIGKYSSPMDPMGYVFGGVNLQVQLTSLGPFPTKRPEVLVLAGLPTFQITIRPGHSGPVERFKRSLVVTVFGCFQK